MAFPQLLLRVHDHYCDSFYMFMTPFSPLRPLSLSSHSSGCGLFMESHHSYFLVCRLTRQKWKSNQTIKSLEELLHPSKISKHWSKDLKKRKKKTHTQLMRKLRKLHVKAYLLQNCLSIFSSHLLVPQSINSLLVLGIHFGQLVGMK